MHWFGHGTQLQECAIPTMELLGPQRLVENHEPNNKNETMPILLWLIGVPLSLILLLMLTGVVHF